MNQSLQLTAVAEMFCDRCGDRDACFKALHGLKAQSAASWGHGVLQ